MTNDNPYAAPQETVEDRVKVDGNLLVVNKRTELPDRCVYSNEPTRKSQRTEQRLRWTGGRGKLVVMSKSCTIRFGISRGARLRIWGQTIAGALIIAGAVSLLITLAIPNSLVLSAISGFVLAGGLWLAWNVEVPNLRVVRYEPGRFWIEGICESFLRQLEQEPLEPATVPPEELQPAEHNGSDE